MLDGVEVHVLRLDRRGEKTASWTAHGIDVRSQPCRQRGAAFRGFSLAREIVAAEVERIGPDVVHAQGLGPEGTSVAALQGTPTVITPHGHPRRDVLMNRSGAGAFIEGYVRTLLAGWALRRASLCIAVGPERSNLARLSSRVTRVPNPVRREFFTDRDEAVSRSTLLVPASVKRIKGIERVFEAAAAVGVRSLTVAGGVEDDGYLDELHTAARRLGLRVEWKGNLGPEALSKEYDRALMMALGSDWEVSPVCIAEAMIRGCPVVAPSHPGIEVMLSHGEFGWLYRARDEEDLARALEDVVTDQSGARARCRVAEDHARREYDPARIAQLIVGEYELLAKRQKGERP